MAEPICGEPYGGDRGVWRDLLPRCERPAGHDGDCGPAERCGVPWRTKPGGRRVVGWCQHTLPCPVPGHKNAGGGEGVPAAAVTRLSPASGSSAPERPPADDDRWSSDDILRLYLDTVKLMIRLGLTPSLRFMKDTLVRAGWRPPGEARPIDRDALAEVLWELFGAAMVPVFSGRAWTDMGEPFRESWTKCYADAVAAHLAGEDANDD